MDKIREETQTIYIHFWDKYDTFINELTYDKTTYDKTTYKYQHAFLEELDTEKNTKTNTKYLANLFSLYFYIIDYVGVIYNNTCESSDEILSILSIYSLICKEFDYFFRLHLNLDDILVMEINREMINSMCIINNLNDTDISNILGEVEGECEALSTTYSHSNHIINAKQRLFKLYLKLLSII